MKTERVTLLTSPDFKAFLNAEAHREGVSVAELVRTRCERRPSDEEVMLAELTRELQRSVDVAKRSLKSGLDEAQAVLKELSLQRSGVATSANAELIRMPKAVAKVTPQRAAAAAKTPKEQPKEQPKRTATGAGSGATAKALKGARP